MYIIHLLSLPNNSCYVVIRMIFILVRSITTSDRDEDRSITTSDRDEDCTLEDVERILETGDQGARLPTLEKQSHPESDHIHEDNAVSTPTGNNTPSDPN